MITRKICEPLEEDSFRPILHHYDGPKFRLELNVPEVFNLADSFERDILTYFRIRGRNGSGQFLKWSC